MDQFDWASRDHAPERRGELHSSFEGLRRRGAQEGENAGGARRCAGRRRTGWRGAGEDGQELQGQGEDAAAAGRGDQAR
eukprot:4540217-Pyramimonas_sp.AAC.1